MNPPERRPSFGMLLRRSKSGDLVKGGKKAQALREAELERQRQANRVPPKLPEFANNTEQLSKSFGVDLRPSSSSNYRQNRYDSGSGRPSMEPTYGYTSNVPMPPIPNGGFDPYARNESMTHRGRYSYASSAVSTINSPRRVRRRKDPTPFNILVIGTRGSGKTSFLEFLKTALALPPRKRSKKTEQDDFHLPAPLSGNFVPHYLETEIDTERVGLTLWDSEGFEKNLIDLQLRELSAFLESKFEETFNEEMKVVRSPGVQDTHIHAVFLVLDPSRLDRSIAAARSIAGMNGHANLNGHNGLNGLNGLNGVNGQNGQTGHTSRVTGGLDEEVDLQVLRTLRGKTTVIPVIGKADTITTKHMSVLKKAVWDSIKKSNMDPLEALGLNNDEDNGSSSDRIDEESDEDGSKENALEDSDDSINDLPIQGPIVSASASPNSKRMSTQSIRKHKAQEEVKEEETPFLPLSIISPDLYEPGIVGRQFPWGFADPYNEEHCDFTRLKEAAFSEWRAELREASKEQWYEGWRTSRLKQRDLPHRRR